MSQAILDRELNDCLRVEMSWKDVASGIGKVLTGYAIWVGGTLFALMLILIPIVENGFKVPTRLKLGHLWSFYAGLGLLSVIGIISCGVIMAGKFRCALSAPERYGCRWWVFLCMTALGMTVGLSLLASLSGLEVKPELDRGVAGLWQVRYSTVGIIFNVASLFLSMAYTCSFALFLRSVAQCMDSRWHVRMVDLFLSYFVPLSMVSGFLSIKLATGNQEAIKLLVFVGLGWAICFIYWLTMMVLVRSCILQTIERVKDPMEYSSLHQQPPQREFDY